MSGRNQVIVFSLLWLLPSVVLLCWPGGVEKLPPSLRLLFLQPWSEKPRNGAWASYYLSGQTGIPNAQAASPMFPMEWDTFASSGTPTGRPRLEAAVALTDGKPEGEATRLNAARYAATWLAKREPQAPKLVQVQVLANDRPIGSLALARPAGEWWNAPIPLLDQSSVKRRELGTYPVGKSTVKLSPYVLTASPEFNDAALRELAGNSKVVDLDLSASAVTGGGLAILEKHPTLRSLRLKDMAISDDHLSWLVKMPNLSGLDLSGTKVGDGCLTTLKQLTRLQELRLARTQIGPSAVANLAEMRNLVILDVSDTAVAHPVLLQLSAWPRLRTLVMNKIQLDGESWAKANPHNSLTHLDLAGALVGKSGLSVVKLFPMVQTLNLDGASIGDADLMPLTMMRNLQTVNLANTNATEAGLRRLLLGGGLISFIRYGVNGEKTLNAPRKTTTEPVAGIATRPTVKGPGAPGAAPRSVTGQGKPPWNLQSPGGKSGPTPTTPQGQPVVQPRRFSVTPTLTPPKSGAPIKGDTLKTKNP